MAPDADIATPQSTACAVCPRNVFKVNAEGRKSKDCSDYKRLAVLILPSMTKALLGAPLMEPVFLRVPAASLNDLALLGEGMAAQGFHFSSYITRIGFNPEKPHPQMTFRALQGLTDREAPLVLPMRDDPTAIRITGENETGKTRPATAAAPQTAQTAAPAIAQPDPAIEAARVAAAAAAETARKAEEARQAALKQAADDAAKAAAANTVDTGFGDLGGASDPAPLVTAAVNGVAGFDTTTAAPTTAAPANTDADTGAPEDADADLDARITALLPK